MKKIVIRMLSYCMLSAVSLLVLFHAAEPLYAADFPQKLGITYVKAPLNVPSIVAKELKIFEKSFPGVSLSFPELTQGDRKSVV